MILDNYDDRGALMRQAYPEYQQIPEWIRSAGIPEKDLTKLASADFAVSFMTAQGLRHAYPVMNDAATAVSCFYFENTHPNLPSELQKVAAAGLLEACRRFDIEPSDTVAKLATDYQEEGPNANWHKTPFQSQGLGDTSWFPLDTPEQVKIASELFPTIIRKLASDERREFAVNLMQKAAEFDITVHSDVKRWGGNVLSKVAALDALEKRAQLMTSDQALLLRQSADRILELHPEKVASLLEQMDSEYGFDALWDRGLSDPQAIHDQAMTEAMAKIAEGIEIPMESWKTAVDAGALNVFTEDIQSALKNRPDLLANYEGSPIHGFVMDRLSDLGIIGSGNPVN